MPTSQDGFPEWTELGQDSGLDPLGMQRPIEVIYQSLVPGISTITLRYRYYSLFSLVLKHYEENVRDADPERFRAFLRRCEALFALICCHGEAELGITGSDWATKQLAAVSQTDPEAVIDFALGADQNADVSLRYLKNKGGAFGGIYSTQMSEMGLVHFPEPGQPNPNPVCSDVALKLADAMSQELNGKAEAFFDAVDAGFVSVATLGSLDAFKPTRLKAGSLEHRLLLDILLGKTRGTSEPDKMRQRTLLMLLELADKNRAVPRAEQVKWEWFENVPLEVRQAAPPVPQLWFVYQASDLMRLAYEVILHSALTLVESAPRGRRALAELTEEIASYARIDAGQSWQEFAAQLNPSNDIADVRVTASAMLDGLAAGVIEDQVRHAAVLIALLGRQTKDNSDLIDKVLAGADHFQSLRTEMQYIDRNQSRNAQDVVRELVRDRVLKRHLWVASRKFRNQKAYTFLMEPEEGLLRHRGHFKVSPSSPRLDQALRFLRDVHLIGDAGITEIGLSELVAA